MKRTYNEDDDDDFEENYDDDEPVYVNCPYCKGTMLEAAGFCPACDRWITDEDRPQNRPSLWVALVIGLLIIAFLIAVIPI